MTSFDLVDYVPGQKNIGTGYSKSNGGRYHRNRNVYHKEKRRHRVGQNGGWTDMGICLYQQIPIFAMGYRHENRICLGLLRQRRQQLGLRNIVRQLILSATDSGSGAQLACKFG